MKDYANIDGNLACAARDYETKLIKTFLLPPLVDVVLGACCIWKRETGNKIEPAVNPGSITLTIHMDQPMKNGELPNKGYHIGLLLEHISEHAAPYLSSPDFKNTYDKYSNDFRWETIGNFPNITLWVYHGGNCKLVQVGTETIEKPVYAVDCA